MEEHGYTVQVEDHSDLAAIKRQYAVPPGVQSCHTAIVDGYIIEGHVPAAEVDRLLRERPPIAGLAVPGMPIGSPGMESADGRVEPYDVVAFDSSGQVTVYASYGQ
jgi:hypothetical protein